MMGNQVQKYLEMKESTPVNSEVRKQPRRFDSLA